MDNRDGKERGDSTTVVTYSQAQPPPKGRAIERRIR